MHPEGKNLRDERICPTEIANFNRTSPVFFEKMGLLDLLRIFIRNNPIVKNMSIL